MKSLILANWKMNPPSLKDAKRLVAATKKALAGTKGVSVIIAPPAVFLRDVGTMLRGGEMGLAAQNVHFETGGAFTGEISVAQVRDAKAHYALVGHAERRMVGETNDETRKKINALLAANMTPILCVGEKTRGEDAEHFLFVKEQLLEGLADVSGAKLSKIVIAYEPVWAIGAPAPMQPRDMHEMSIFIRKTLVEKFGEGAMAVGILYGGAVDATNAASMLREGDVKGFLVGRASVDAAAFSQLLKASAAA